MRYNEILNELYQRRTRGIKLGLERVLRVLDKLGNPHKSFRSIHIAGTNGKGSVSKIIYTLLRAHGFSVGLFTSPHLTRFTERIVVNETEISEEDVVRLVEKVRPLSDELTFFEYVTVIAFLYFKEKGVDYAVLETGMGGRLDSTNVVKPEISIITSIGLDHQQFLGQDLASIAKEKAGIIKKSVPVVIANQPKEAEEIIIETANNTEAPLYIYGKDFYSNLKFMSLEGLLFDFYPRNTPPHAPITDLSFSLTGLHQLENVSLALKAFIEFYPKYNENAIREGLKKVKMPGRLEIISKKPLIILDIAHNPDGAYYLIQSLKLLTEKKPVVVFGVMKDKDVNGIIKHFDGYAEKIIFTSPEYERALNYEELLKRLNGYSINICSSQSPKQAFNEGLSICYQNPELFLLCTGSVYLIGEIKEFLGETAIHRKLGELL
ncbi:bifunctional folylpolyglutamate synthase/dihydrofolate synthase [Thermodesulfovibrio hydrogeniphilus]